MFSGKLEFLAVPYCQKDSVMKRDLGKSVAEIWDCTEKRIVKHSINRNAERRGEVVFQHIVFPREFHKHNIKLQKSLLIKPWENFIAWRTAV